MLPFGVTIPATVPQGRKSRRDLWITLYLGRKQETPLSVTLFFTPHWVWYLPALHVVFVPRTKPRIGATCFLLDSRPLKIGTINCIKMSVRHYHYSLRNNPEGSNSLLNTRIFLWFFGEFGELTPLSCIACMTICCSVHKSALTYKEIIFSTFSNQ